MTGPQCILPVSTGGVLFLILKTYKVWPRGHVICCREGDAFQAGHFSGRLISHHPRWSRPPRFWTPGILLLTASLYGRTWSSGKWPLAPSGLLYMYQELHGDKNSFMPYLNHLRFLNLIVFFSAMHKPVANILLCFRACNC